MYRSRERVHVTREGRVVPPGHPQSAFLLVAAGGEIPDEVARRYGLTGAPIASLQQSEALPLESPPSTPPSQASQITGAVEHGFPPKIQLGGTQESSSNSIAATTPPIPPVSSVAPQGTVVPPSQPESSTDLPDDFPFKSILVARNFGTVEKVKATTKEVLIGLEQIGSARADEILAAREKLG